MTKRLLTVTLAILLLGAPPTSAQWRPGSLMRIVLLVDSSAAVSPMLGQFRAGLNDFLDALPGDPEIALISSGGNLRIRVAPTSDRAKLRAAASSFAPDGGGNSFLETLLEADKRFLKTVPDRRSVFVILTSDAGWALGDQRADVYNKFVDQFLARGGRAHAVVVRGVNSGPTTQVAENLAHNTGGFFETVGVASAVPRMMKALAGYVAADQ